MEPVTVRRWLPRAVEPDPQQIRTLAASCAVRPLTAQLLLARGLDNAEDGRCFLQARLASLPDPALLAGMERAVERLADAVCAGERIAVHGDYDVDGITAAALLVEGLRALGATVDCHIPLRLRDGYGLSGEALQRAAAAGARIAISVDCGIGALEEARLAGELGLDLIITDHHLPAAQLPEAFALINPQLPSCNFPFKPLAGVGVAFLLFTALRRRLRERGFFAAHAEPDLRRSLDLVALGTIADVVPLTGVNRVLTKAGLEVLNRRQRLGIAALLEVAAIKEASCGTVAFTLAPRLNAAGRLEDAALGVELLLTDDPDVARSLAQRLDQCNRERQQIEQETLRQAIERLEQGGEGGRYSIVLADQSWHPGVIGIVASRLAERYHRPTALIAIEDGLGKGSARSAAGLHLYQALAACSTHLNGFGGHAQAAGLSIDADQLTAFTAAFEEQVSQLLAFEERTPALRHDGELQLEELDRTGVEELAALAPFGAGNPEPLFLFRQLRAQQVTTVGERHLRFTARQGGISLPCIAFGMVERASELTETFDLLATPQLNQWQGRTQLQLRVRDMRPTVAE